MFLSFDGIVSLFWLPVTIYVIGQTTQEYRVLFKKLDKKGDVYLTEAYHNIYSIIFLNTLIQISYLWFALPDNCSGIYLINANMEVPKCLGVEYKWKI